MNVSVTTSSTFASVVVELLDAIATLLNVGAVVSITNALESDNEFEAPGVGSVNTASLPLTSFIVPPDKASAEVEA